MKLSRRGLLQGAAAFGSLWAAGCATTPRTSTPPKGEASASSSSAARPSWAPSSWRRRARGHTVTLFNRGKTRPQLFPDVEKLQGDRDPNKGEGLKALEGRTWDAVIDTSGYVPRPVRASAQLLAPHVGQYVFISSISVYKDMTRPGLDETAPVATTSDPANETIGEENYGALKALCEQEAEAAFPGRTTNIRPGLIVGPEDPTQRFTYWPERVARGGEVLAPGDGSDPVQFIDVRDLAEWTLHALDNRDFGVFNATGPTRPLTVRELLEACKQASQSDATFTWADAAFLEQQKVSGWSDLPVWVPSTGDSAGVGQSATPGPWREG
ncbi:NAD-dependent epimerase/dehydratase family protein [Cystobacter fuscus]